jgi:hypothetical protein
MRAALAKCASSTYPDPVAQRSVTVAATSLANFLYRAAQTQGLGVPVDRDWPMVVMGGGRDRLHAIGRLKWPAWPLKDCACADSHAVMTQSVCVCP